MLIRRSAKNRRLAHYLSSSTAWYRNSAELTRSNGKLDEPFHAPTVRISAMSTASLGGGFNRSMQHIKSCMSRRSVADELPDANLLHGRPEGIDVGAIEAGLDAPSDCPVVQSTSHVSAGNPFSNWRLSASGTQPLRNGADVD